MAGTGRGVVGLASLAHSGVPDPGGPRDGPRAARTLCPAFGTLLDLALPPGSLGPDALGRLAQACGLELAATINLGGPRGPDAPCAGAAPPLPAAMLAAYAGATATALRERVPAPALAAYAAARRAYWRGGLPSGPPLTA